MAERSHRRSFGPVVLAGLAGAGLVAMAANEDWIASGACDSVAVTVLEADAPAANALALALLASWGVLLVTRGRVRRVAAVVAALLAVGLVAAVVLGAVSLRSDDSLIAPGADCALDLTGWFGVAAAALPLAVLPAVAAVWLVPSWPEMGRKYDAPADRAESAVSPADRDNLDLWKAIDEGDDPTA